MGKFLRCRNYFYEIILICFGSIHTEKSCKRPADSPSLCTASLASLWISIFLQRKMWIPLKCVCFPKKAVGRQHITLGLLKLSTTITSR